MWRWAGEDLPHEGDEQSKKRRGKWERKWGDPTPQVHFRLERKWGDSTPQVHFRFSWRTRGVITVLLKSSSPTFIFSWTRKVTNKNSKIKVCPELFLTSLFNYSERLNPRSVHNCLSSPDLSNQTPQHIISQGFPHCVCRAVLQRKANGYTHMPNNKTIIPWAWESLD